MRRRSEETLELKIELAEEKAAKTRAAHEKAIDEQKKLYDIRRARQNEEIPKALEKSSRSFDEIMAFITAAESSGKEAV